METMQVEKNVVIEGFKNEINKQILKLTKESITTRRVEELKQALIAAIQTQEIQRKQAEDLKRFSLGIDEKLVGEIEEIKKLPFVKSVELVAEGIKIDVGKVDIKFRAKEIYIGDFIIYITPSGVKIKNTNPVIVEHDWGGTYEVGHPHMDGEHICFGSARSVKVHEYFAEFEFKKLTYFVYLFLKGFNMTDSYNSITYWTNKNVKRKKDAKENKTLA